MEAKRKIVIPVGGRSEEPSPDQSFDGGETVPAPLFDEEATISARPVVPLAPETTATATTAQQRGTGPLNGRFPLLALVIVLAIAAGVAGGFAIGIYKSRLNNAQQATTTTTTPAAATEETTEASPSKELPASAIASDRATEMPERDRTGERRTETADTSAAAATSSKPAREEKVTPPVEIADSARDRRTRAARDGGERKETVNDEVANDEREARHQRREERREQRRRARKVDEYQIPQQQVERANRELNRIREIFEGPRP